VLPARAFWWAIGGIFAGIVLSIVFSIPVLVVAPNSRALLLLIGEIGLWTGLGGSCVIVSHIYGTGHLRRDYALRFEPIDIAIGPLVAFACLLVAGIVGSFFVHTHYAGSNTGIVKDVRNDPLAFAVVAGIAAIGAPFFEELFFRGLIRRSLEAKVGWIAAIWLQAVLFGLAHAQFGMGAGNVAIVAGTFSLGVVLGYTARYSGRLGPGIVGHGLFNAVVSLAIFAAR
jgi:membrane protease YdiL (CAAX protease family)